MASKKNYEFEVDINGDISGLKQAMNKAVAEFNSMDRSLKNIQKARELAPSDEALLSKEMKMYASTIHEAEVALKQLYKQKKQIERSENYKKGYTDELEQYTKLTLKIKEVQARKKELQEMQSSMPTREQDRINRKFQEYVDAVKDAVEETEKYKSILSNIDKQMELDPDNADLYAQKQTVLNELLEVYKNNLVNVNTAKEKFENSSNDTFYKNHEKEISDVSLKVQELGNGFEETKQKEAEMISIDLSRFASQMESLSATMGTIASKTGGMSRIFQGLLTDGFNVAKEYETDVANIRKVAGDLSDDVVDDLKRIAVETGKTFGEVSEYATISAALGLAGDEISSYTKALIDLNTVSGGAFSGEEGAKNVAVFLKQLNLGIDQAENFGSAIAVIGDKYADIGDETLNVATHLSGIATLVNTNQYELLGLAGVMADLGLSADTNANAVNRSFLQIQKAVEEGKGKLTAIASTAGMTSEQFKRAWGENAVNAFLKFTDGLKGETFTAINKAIDKSSSKVQEYADVLGMSADVFKEKWLSDSNAVFDMYIEKLGEMDEGSTDVSTSLTKIGLSSVNTAQTLLRLAGSGNEVRSAIQLATQAWDENTAIQEKTNILYSTTESKLNSFYESLRQAKGSVIENVLPTLKEMIDVFTKMADAFGKADPTLQKLVGVFLALGASVSPVARGVSNVSGMMASLAKLSGKFAKETGKAMEEAAEGVEGVGKNVAILKSLFTSLPKALTVTGIIAGVVALGFAIKKAYDNSKDATYYAMQDMANLKKSSFSLKNEIDALNLTIADNTKQWELDQIPLQKQVETIDELYKTIKEGNLTEEESKNAKEELKQKIDELNTSLGENKWNFDETKGAIVDEKGEIVDGLIPAYQELAVERKKSYLLEQLQEAYMEALEKEEEAVRNREQATDNWITVLDEAKRKSEETSGFYSDEFVDFAKAMDLMDQEDWSFFQSLDKDAQNTALSIKTAYMNLGDMNKATQEIHDSAQNTLQAYEDLGNATAEEAEKLMWLFQTFGTTDVLKIPLEDVQALIDEINNKLLYSDQLQKGDITNLTELRAQYQTLAREISAALDEEEKKKQELHEKELEQYEELTKREIEKTKEMYNHEDGIIVRQIEEGTDTIYNYQTTMNKKMWDENLREALLTDDLITQRINSNIAYKRVRLLIDGGSESIGGGGAPSVVSSSQLMTMDSGGFGNAFDGVFNAVRNSLGNIRSGGFNSGGITVNANFTINNGNDINQGTVRGWGRSIAEQINEYLGSQI